MVEGTIPNQLLLESEWNALRQMLKETYDDLDIIPFPSKLDDLNSDSWKHDFIFVRDLFVSNQNGDVVVARFREKERQAEEEIIEEWLMQQDVKVHKLPFEKNYFVEGGEFYF